jgi:transposase InsO family protein
MLAQDYPVVLACEVLDCTRSSYYYRAKEPVDEAKLRSDIEKLTMKWPTYGYRRIAEELRRQGWAINHKRVQRLMRAMDLQVQTKHKKQATTDSNHSLPHYPNLVRDLKIVRADQVWVSDITYIRLLHDFVYLAVIMDVFTRCIRGWCLRRRLDQHLTLTALECALDHHIPEIHHSDQGVQYAAKAYTQMLKDIKVQISMADKGKAWQNGYAERLIRTIKEEEVYLSEYETYTDALQQVGHFLDDIYMRKRIHSSLGYLTPVEFETEWQREQKAAINVH